jgi:hypothetical protein
MAREALISEVRGGEQIVSALWDFLALPPLSFLIYLGDYIDLCAVSWGTAQILIS